MTISGPMRADSETILATEKTEAKRRGWSGQRPGEKDKVRGRDLPQRQAGRGLLLRASPHRDSDTGWDLWPPHRRAPRSPGEP